MKQTYFLVIHEVKRQPTIADNRTTQFVCKVFTDYVRARLFLETCKDGAEMYRRENYDVRPFGTPVKNWSSTHLIERK